MDNDSVESNKSVVKEALASTLREVGGQRAGRISVTYTAYMRLTMFPPEFMEHVVFCLQAVGQVQDMSEIKLGSAELATVRLALIYAWTQDSPKESAVWAFEELTTRTAGEVPLLPQTIKDLILTVHGEKSPSTLLEEFIVKAGLRSSDIELAKRRGAIRLVA